MTFNWIDFLVFAKNIEAAPAVPGPEEAALRSAVSRAYYAAFHAAMEHGKKSGFMPKGSGDDHGGIQEHFRKLLPEHQEKSKISLQLHRLRDLRRQADYENTLMQKPETMASNAISMAKVVFDCIDELSRHSP